MRLAEPCSQQSIRCMIIRYLTDLGRDADDNDYNEEQDDEENAEAK